MFFVAALMFWIQENFRKVTAIQWLVVGYGVIVTLVAFLFTLPISSAEGTRQSFIDALFVASSGISTTGLTPVDLGKYYSLFGQIVLLIEFQIGGISHMTVFVLLVFLFGRRLSVVNRIVARESVAGATFSDLFGFFRAVTLITLLFEAIGAVILTLCWLREFPLSEALWFGIFHSVSAFCTAGMGLFTDSLISYRESEILCLTITVLSILGGIGFFVLDDLYVKFKGIFKGQPLVGRLSVHTKLTLLLTAIAYLIGTIILFNAEPSASFSGIWDRWRTAAFQVISAMTTDGFNTLDIGTMTAESLLALILLMFIGSSPGGTGGGLKSTTFGMVLTATWAYLLQKDNVNLFHRRIPLATIDKAFVIFFCFSVLMGCVTLLLMFTEKASLVEVLFEVTSALSNTGLSMGITSKLSTVGKLALSMLMFIGRVGPLTFGFALVGKPRRAAFQYAEANVFVG